LQQTTINYLIAKLAIQLIGGENMQTAKMKTKLEERLKALEKEKSMLLEEIGQLKEIVELSEKVKGLESEVGKLRREVKTLEEKIPQELLQELSEAVPHLMEEEEEENLGEECSSCEEEEQL
jgi:peptidoglycan hydrolase CwlO-like protein